MGAEPIVGPFSLPSLSSLHSPPSLPSQHKVPHLKPAAGWVWYVVVAPLLVEAMLENFKEESFYRLNLFLKINAKIL